MPCALAMARIRASFSIPKTPWSSVTCLAKSLSFGMVILLSSFSSISLPPFDNFYDLVAYFPPYQNGRSSQVKVQYRSDPSPGEKDHRAARKGSPRRQARARLLQSFGAARGADLGSSG